MWLFSREQNFDVVKYFIEKLSSAAARIAIRPYPEHIVSSTHPLAQEL